MLGAHVLVGERLGLPERGVQGGPKRRRDADLAALRVYLGQPVERRVHLVAQRLGRDVEPVQQWVDHPFGVRQQREEQVLGLDRLVAARQRLLPRPFERRLGLHGQLVRVHPFLISIQSSAVIPYIA